MGKQRTWKEELLKKLNPVFIVPSDFQVPIHFFGRKYEVILTLKENCYEPEKCVTGNPGIFYIDGSRKGQGSEAQVPQEDYVCQKTVKILMNVTIKAKNVIMFY